MEGELGAVAGDETAVFEIVEARPGQEPIVHRCQEYPVIMIGEEGVSLDLPGRRTTIGEPFVLECRDAIVFSERDGDALNLVGWWRRILEEHSRAFVSIEGTAWAPGLFDWCGMRADARKDATAALEKLADGSNPPERAEALAGWGRRIKKPVTLIINNLSALGEDAGTEVAAALRLIREKGFCPNLHILLASTSEDVVKDLPNQSGYIGCCVQLCPRSLTAEEVRALGRWAPASDSAWVTVEFAKPALSEFMAHSGGKPVLVRQLLQRLRKLRGAGRWRTARKEDVLEAAEQMRRSPPPEVRFWQDDLEALLTGQQQLVSAMEAYVSGRSMGSSRFPPPSLERPLFLSGWMQVNERGRWGIASATHAHLAAAILRKVAAKKD